MPRAAPAVPWPRRVRDPPTAIAPSRPLRQPERMLQRTIGVLALAVLTIGCTSPPAWQGLEDAGSKEDASKGDVSMPDASLAASFEVRGSVEQVDVWKA